MSSLLKHKYRFLCYVLKIESCGRKEAENNTGRTFLENKTKKPHQHFLPKPNQTPNFLSVFSHENSNNLILLRTLLNMPSTNIIRRFVQNPLGNFMMSTLLNQKLNLSSDSLSSLSAKIVTNLCSD